jgi:hypothetical protein
MGQMQTLINTQPTANDTPLARCFCFPCFVLTFNLSAGQQAMKVTASLVVLLLVALVCASCASSSRSRMLLSCEDDCQKGYESNVARCIADYRIGPPPLPKAVGFGTVVYTQPRSTAFELIEQDCRKQQAFEFNKCKAACVPARDCNEVVKTCRSTFKEGTVREAYCKQSKGC